MLARAVRITILAAGIFTAALGLLAVGFFAGMQYQAGQPALATGSGLPVLGLPLVPTESANNGTPGDLTGTFRPF